MPGLGRRTFAAGEVLTASNVMGYLQDQAVMNFAGTAARGSAIGTAVSQGMVSYLDDTNDIQVYKTVGTAVARWESNTTPQSPNMIINGAFEINQRSFTSINTSAAYGFDRWQLFFSGGTITNTPQTFSPGALPVASFEGANFSRLVTSGFSSGFGIYRQQIEDVRTLAGQTATISFWAKAASGTPNIMPGVEQIFGDGGSPSSAVRTLSAPIPITTSWARYSATINVPSISGKTIGTTANTSALSVELWLSGSSAGNQNNTFDIWGVQVEAGSTATPFRRNANSIQGELNACRRYFWRLGGTAGVTRLGVGWAVFTTLGYSIIQPPVEMRVAPTLAVSGTTFLWYDGATGSTVTPAAGVFNRQTFELTFSGTGMTVGRGLGFTSDNANSFLSFSAEF